MDGRKRARPDMRTVGPDHSRFGRVAFYPMESAPEDDEEISGWIRQYNKFLEMVLSAKMEEKEMNYMKCKTLHGRILRARVAKRLAG